MSETSNDANEVSSYPVDSTFGITKNLVILKEFDNIVNCVSDDEFLALAPTSVNRVKWRNLFHCLKDIILDDTNQKWNSMWEEENMSEKIASLETQINKFPETADKPAWRPQLGDVKAQLRPYEMASMLMIKKVLEAQTQASEERVAKLKETVIAHRGFFKALEVDIQKYQKKNEDCQNKIEENIKMVQKALKKINPDLLIKIDDSFRFVKK